MLSSKWLRCLHGPSAMKIWQVHVNWVMNDRNVADDVLFEVTSVWSN